MFQNYPNPFNPETWLPYELAQPSYVLITIYDGFGQPVRTLDLGKQSADSYRSKAKAAHWDGRSEGGEAVGSGIYFYHLKTDTFQSTRKMIILK